MNGCSRVVGRGLGNRSTDEADHECGVPPSQSGVEVAQRIRRGARITYSALVPNRQGLESVMGGGTSCPDERQPNSMCALERFAVNFHAPRSRFSIAIRSSRGSAATRMSRGHDSSTTRPAAASALWISEKMLSTISDRSTGARTSSDRPIRESCKTSSITCAIRRAAA